MIPDKDGFYRLADDIGHFEVVKIDEEDSMVTVREICTDTEHKLSFEFFFTIFIQTQKPEVNIAKT